MVGDHVRDSCSVARGLETLIPPAPAGGGMSALRPQRALLVVALTPVARRECRRPGRGDGEG